MNTDHHLVTEQTTLRASMAQIDSTGKGIVFVTDEDGHLLGSVSDGDIRRAILDGRQLRTPVSAVMNEDPVVVSDPPSGAVDGTTLRRVQARIDSPDTLVAPVVDDDGVVVDVCSVSTDGHVTPLDPEPTSRAVDTVLVIGGAGYIGSVLCRQLLAKGYDVRVLDQLLYTDEGVATLEDDDGFTLIRGDMRSISDVMDAIDGADAVVCLGALVGDPASSIDPRRTLELNYHAVKIVADICKYHQVNRFVFASTCSVYGESDPTDLLTEQSDLNPLSLYGKTKARSEEALLSMVDENFAPTILRMGTVYGRSPRMRFDLVVNVLTAKAYEEGEIPIFGGEQYRPNVHVADAARAYVACLEAPLSAVHGEVFNVGSNEQNYRIVELGEIVADCVPDARIDRQADRTDERSYRVDFGKIRAALDYETDHTVRDGCLEIVEALRTDDIADYERDVYHNYRTVAANTDVLEEV